MKSRILQGLMLIAALLTNSNSANAGAPLVADLSEDLVAITAGFEGSDLLLFGATDGEGEVIVVVRGATSDVVVRRKARVAGIWINRDDVLFSDVPNFYHVASSAPIEEILPIDVLKGEQIGVEQLVLEPALTLEANEKAAFRAALVRNQQRRALYTSKVEAVSFVGGQLFRTKISFPANVQTGPYLAEVYLVDGGVIVSKTTTPLRVSKQGFEARMFSFAHDQSALYGLIAIAVALMAGWFAGFVFRKA
ncbi:MAG: TIGR02186 family protein [Alphaproteobacteria bacterium]